MNNEVKNQILEEAARHFLSFGYSKVTTESLVASLGISKKTLYKYFPSKKVLLSESMKFMMEQFGSRLPDFSYEAGQDYTTQFRKFLFLLATHVVEVNMPIIQYLQKKAPEIWKEIDNFRQKNIAAKFALFWEKGVQAGKINSEIDHHLVLLMFISSLCALTDQDNLFFTTGPQEQIINSIIAILCNGIFLPENPSGVKGDI